MSLCKAVLARVLSSVLLEHFFFIPVELNITFLPPADRTFYPSSLSRTALQGHTVAYHGV